MNTPIKTLDEKIHEKLIKNGKNGRSKIFNLRFITHIF